MDCGICQGNMFKSLNTMKGFKKIDDPDSTHLDEAQTYLDNKRAKGKTSLIIIALLVIVFVFCLVLYANGRELKVYRNDYEQMVTKNNSLRSEISDLTQERDDAKTELSNFKETVSSLYPLIIADIEIANCYKGGSIETNYGSQIYSLNTMYLCPRIKYDGLICGDKTLKIKWYCPDGTLSRGVDSPDGFSQCRSYHIYKGHNNTLTFIGWGNENKGNWKSGTYRIEIWYGDSCLKAKTFKIY